MSIQFEGIYERDMDLLFMRKIASDKGFVREFFLNNEAFLKKGYDTTTFSVESVSHSVRTEDGESDIEVVLSIRDKKIALLIEDKVDAKAQPEQAARYTIRGDKALSRGDYDDYCVFIIAPEDYLESNAEAKNYPGKITYESIQKK